MRKLKVIKGIEFSYVDKNGNPYVRNRFFYHISVWRQLFFWKIGLPYHNRYADECTPDFNCCIKKKI